LSQSYSWLLGWITRKGARKTQHLSVDTSFVESDSGKINTHYEFQPSVGTHFMRYEGTWIRVERTREQRMLEPWETVQLTTFGRHRDLFVNILEESRMLGNRRITNILE
jgi:chaperone BCS1